MKKCTICLNKDIEVKVKFMCKKCYDREWCRNNKEKVRKHNKNRYQKNRKANIQKSRLILANVPPQIIAARRAKCWEKLKKDSVRYLKYVDKCRKWKQDKYKSDPVFKIKHNLRNRLNMAIKEDGYKSGSAIKDLGCSVEELKRHLESKWQPGMTWSNYGRKGWHIDHIIPLDAFDLTNKEELLKACHYTNLQPLWAHDNHTKSSKI